MDHKRQINQREYSIYVLKIKGMKSPAQTKMKSSPHPHKLTKQVLPWTGLFGVSNLNGLGSFSQMGYLYV